MAHGSTPTGGTLTVRGPASSTDSNLAMFDGATGKNIKESTVANSALLAALTKLELLTITSSRDLDALAAAIALNTAKTTNATHTGDVTGDSALTLAASGVSAGTYLGPSSVTVDSKGRVTAIAAGRSGTIVQQKVLVNSAVTALTTIIPIDATTPLVTEGDQVFSQAFTATSLSNRLRIEISLHLSNAAAVNCVVALFVGSDTCARAWAEGVSVAGGYINPVFVANDITPGTLSEQLIRVRVGPAIAGTFRLNGLAAGGSIFGAAAGTAVSCLTITEYTP